MEQKWATWVEAVRNQSVLSLAVIEQRGISEPGLGGKRTLVSTFFKQRIPQTDRDCIAGIAYVRSTVHAGEHIKQRILFRAEANITRLGKKSEGILASKAYRMRASTILNLSCEHLSKAHGGRGDVSKLQCCWYYKDMIMWLRLLEGTLRSPLCMRPPPTSVSGWEISLTTRMRRPWWAVLSFIQLSATCAFFFARVPRFSVSVSRSGPTGFCFQCYSSTCHGLIKCRFTLLYSRN